MYRILERNRNGLEQIIAPVGTLSQVKSRINTMNKMNKLFGNTNVTYKPIKI